MAEWFADDGFWADLFPFEVGDSAFTAGEAQVERVVTLSGVDRGDALDFGCGPARHAIALANRGFPSSVVGPSSWTC